MNGGTSPPWPIKLGTEAERPKVTRPINNTPQAGHSSRLLSFMVSANVVGDGNQGSWLSVGGPQGRGTDLPRTPAEDPSAPHWPLPYSVALFSHLGDARGSHDPRHPHSHSL